MDPKCAKYPKVVLGRPVEGRSCKLHGKAPLTGPYTPKWRPNDEEENATYVAGGGFDKVDGNITILDRGEQIQDQVAMIEEAWVQMSSPSPNLILRLQSFYGVSPCSSWVLFIPTVTAFQCKLCFALPTLHVLITSLNPRAGFRQESCQLALRTIWMQFPDKSREIGNEFEILHLGPCPSERNLVYERYI